MPKAAEYSRSKPGYKPNPVIYRPSTAFTTFTTDKKDPDDSSMNRPGLLTAHRFLTFPVPEAARSSRECRLSRRSECP